VDSTAWTYEHRHLGVVNDVITDATEERAANSAQTYIQQTLQHNIFNVKQRLSEP